MPHAAAKEGQDGRPSLVRLRFYLVIPSCLRFCVLA